MSELKGACIIGQSGGPTSVINASAYGVIDTALKNPNITRVFGAEHGIKGVLNDRLFDMGEEDPAELELLKYTPSSALGSCRYKMKDPDVDDTDYKRILEIFKKYDVRYFFYNGGNDSMDTCNKISKYMQKVGYECRIMGVPKTIDNDLFGTDHCPGYASAAKYIATSCMEVYQDARVYDTGLVCYLTRWTSPETAMAGAMNGALLENFTVSEVMKSYQNAGQEPFLYYYRDSDAKEIDLLLGGDGNIEEHLVDRTREPNIGKEKGFAQKERAEAPLRDPQSRAQDFGPVGGSLTCDQARCEAGRCLQCDLRGDITRVKVWTEYSVK